MINAETLSLNYSGILVSIVNNELGQSVLTLEPTSYSENKQLAEAFVSAEHLAAEHHWPPVQLLQSSIKYLSGKRAPLNKCIQEAGLVEARRRLLIRQAKIAIAKGDIEPVHFSCLQRAVTIARNGCVQKVNTLWDALEFEQYTKEQIAVSFALWSQRISIDNT